MTSDRGGQNPSQKPPRKNGAFARSSRRSAQHAHAQSLDNAAPTSIPDHPLIPSGPPAMVTDQPGLTALCATLRETARFAYDTEFIGELSYYPKLCLIQVATETEVTLIDPFGEIDLTEFWELLADPAVEKILHAGQQDLEPVVRLLDREAANIFDTQIYAGFATLAYPTSLLKMVGELVNVSLGKALTFTHWDARPLSDVHQRYAADDVRYLHAIRAAILDRLDHDEHAAWAREECELLCAKEQYIFDPALRWQRVRGGRNLNPRQIAILKELVVVRDGAAREHDVPPRTMIRDEVLVALAKHPVKTVDQLAQVRGLPRPVEHAYGAAIVKAIEIAKSRPASALPAQSSVEESTQEKRQIDSLWSVVTAFCHGRSIDPALVGTRHDLAQCYRTLLAGETLSDDKLLTGWRGALLGDMLRSFLAGSTGIALCWEGDRLRGSAAACTSDSDGG